MSFLLSWNRPSVVLYCLSQENSGILKELTELRAQKSSLLGFSTHADFVLEMNMAKSGKKVAAFLGESWIASGQKPQCQADSLDVK